MSYNFDKEINRENTSSVKYDGRKEYFGRSDLIPMWVADLDFRSPEPVIKALKERVEHGVFGYPLGLHGFPNESLEFRNIIVDRMNKEFSWSIQPQDLVFLPGVATGFNLACHAVASPRHGVLVQTPIYPPILKAANRTGVLHQEMALTRKKDGSYIVDLEKFVKCITPETRLFILCNPHNPVGKVFTKQELEDMAEICLERNIVICSDEIHCDLVYKGQKHVPIASLGSEIENNTITLMAPSKTYNLAGLKCSYAIIQNRDLRKRYMGVL